jgi:uncharacterized damage-inducible protein DinB
MHRDELLIDFARSAARKLEQDCRQIVRCARLLTDAEAWSRPNQHCNSVANQMLHLTGNIRQWILGGLSDDPTQRDRPAEFAARGPTPIEPIITGLEQTIAAAARILNSLSSDQLALRYSIQGYDVTGLHAAFHVAEHISFHTGQIVHITKAIKNIDLSIYDSQGRLMTAATGQPW